MSYLQLKNVEKAYGDVRVIKGVDLTIEKGEFVVFVGRRAAASRRCFA
jgi:multiple sugar transport system ATP-binding protein